MDTTKQPFLFRPPKYLLDAIKQEAKRNGETTSGLLCRLMRQEYERGHEN